MAQPCGNRLKKLWRSRAYKIIRKQDLDEVLNETHTAPMILVIMSLGWRHHNTEQSSPAWAARSRTVRYSHEKLEGRNVHWKTHSKKGVCLHIVRKTHGFLEVESITCISLFWTWYLVCNAFLCCQSLSQGIVLRYKQVRSNENIINSTRFTYPRVSSIVRDSPLRWRKRLYFWMQ